MVAVEAEVGPAGGVDRAARRADELAGNALRNGPRSRVEIERILLRRGVSMEETAECLGRLEKAGLVNDALFARLWVSSRQRNRGLSRNRLRQELESKGVAEGHVADALGQVDDECEREAARGLALKGLARHRGVEGPVAWRRVAAMLMRRGYGAQLVWSVLAECSVGAGPEGEETAWPADGDEASG